MPVIKSHALVDTILPSLKAAINVLPTPPNMAVVLVGDNPASLSYVKHKEKFGHNIGCTVTLHKLPSTASETDIAAQLAHLAANDATNGIILQLPLPHITNPQGLLEMIPAVKDVDGLGRAQRLLLEQIHPQAILPATPLGILRWLRFLNKELVGKQISIIGRSHLVGAPLATLCTQRGAHVTTFSKEHPIQIEALQASDIVIAAAGVPRLVQADWIKENALVIDVGITRQNGKLLGDCALDIADNAILTAVPGGVGPLTVLSLFTNLVDAAYMQNGLVRPSYL